MHKVRNIQLFTKERERKGGEKEINARIKASYAYGANATD